MQIRNYYVYKKNKEKSSESLKNRVYRWLKFFLIPGYRDPEFTQVEFEIGKIKSKRKFLTRLLNPLTGIGIVIILFIVWLAIFPPWLTPYVIDDLARNFLPGPYSAPSALHPLGTTKGGWDILGRLIWGARTGLTVGIRSILISVIGGVILGVVAAYFGGRLDSVIMRVGDLVSLIPSIVLTMVLVSILGQTVQNILLIFGILGIPGWSRFIRGSILQVKANLYVEAAKTAGAKDFRIMFKHIFPNAMSPLIVSLSSSIGGVVLGLAGMSYLGFGDVTLIDWGTDINIGRNYLFTAPWITIFPGILIALCVLGFILFGDGLRDALDPKLQE